MTFLSKDDKIWNIGFMGGHSGPWWETLGVCYENGTIMSGLWFWAERS